VIGKQPATGMLLVRVVGGWQEAASVDAGALADQFSAQWSWSWSWWCLIRPLTAAMFERWP
jgi:hypothetical protein